MCLNAHLKYWQARGQDPVPVKSKKEKGNLASGAVTKISWDIQVDRELLVSPLEDGH